MPHLLNALEQAARASSAPLPDLAELTTPHELPLAEQWRQVARAAAFGGHDFDAGLGHGRLDDGQFRILIGDVAATVRALVPSSWTVGRGRSRWGCAPARSASGPAGRSAPERWTPPRARAAAAKVKRMTFGEYAAAWLPARKTKGRPLADRTRDHYRDVLDRFILPTFRDVQLTAITPDMIDHWYEVTAIGRPTSQAHS